MSARARALLTGLAALHGVGCVGEETERRYLLEDGSELVLSLPQVREETEAGGRVAYYLASGAIVTVQEIPRRSEPERIERSAATSAAALVERLALGEREGALERRACTLGQLEGHCVDGWMRHGGRRFERSGVVVAIGARIVWLDVAASGRPEAELRREARAVLASARVVEAQSGEVLR